MGVARSQKLQYFVLIVTFILPLMLLAYRLGYFWLLPQFGYGKAVTELATEFSIDIAAPFPAFGLFHWTALCFTLMFGTAGLPHVLSRFYTVPNVRDARWSVVWGLFFIALIYWSAPAYAVFGKLLEARAGMFFPPETAYKMADTVVLRTALIGGLPLWLIGMLAAGAVSAAFFTVAGLLMTGAASISYDIYYRLINPQASETRTDVYCQRRNACSCPGWSCWQRSTRRALLRKLLLLPLPWPAIRSFLSFLLGIWWSDTNRYGVITGMLIGIAITFAQPLAGGFIPVINTLFPLTASSLCGAPIVIAVMILVSRFTTPPSEEIRRFLAEEVHGEQP